VIADTATTKNGVLVFDKLLVRTDEQIALFALRTHISRGQTSGRRNLNAIRRRANKFDPELERNVTNERRHFTACCPSCKYYILQEQERESVCVESAPTHTALSLFAYVLCVYMHGAWRVRPPTFVRLYVSGGFLQRFILGVTAARQCSST
jgi:hypothetical protein